MSAKVVAPLIGAIGVIVATSIATFCSGGRGGDEPTQIIVVPASVQAPASPAPPPPTGSGRNAEETPVREAPAQTRVQFHIHSELGDGQAAERVVVYIDDELKGSVTLDEDNPSSALKITVPRAGTYRFRLDAAAVFYDQLGNTFARSGVDRGTIDVRDGDAFDIELDDSSGEERIILRKR